MKRDPARCDGSNPVGVDLANADRCDFITQPGEECLFPYPNDYFTKADPSTDTGLRLNLNAASTPANSSGVHIDPTDINGSDGFSPGALLVLHVPGMDTPAAFAATGAVPITREGASFDADQPVVLIDAETRERQLIWTELDSNATSPGETDLLIHPAEEPQGRPPLHRRPAPPQERLRRDDPAARGLPPLPGPDPDRDRRGREPARPLQGHLPPPAQRRHRARKPVSRLGLHRRQHPQHLRADALDPRPRARRARGHDPGRRGDAGQRAGDQRHQRRRLPA